MATKRMLIDASHPEETRVVVVDGSRVEDYDVEVASRRQLKGNIYLAKVTRFVAARPPSSSMAAIDTVFSPLMRFTPTIIRSPSPIGSGFSRNRRPLSVKPKATARMPRLTQSSPTKMKTWSAAVLAFPLATTRFKRSSSAAR